MTKAKGEQNGLVMRLLAAIGNRVFGWLLNHEAGFSPYESMMLFPYGTYGWEEYFTQRSLARFKGQEIEGV